MITVGMILFLAPPPPLRLCCLPSLHPMTGWQYVAATVWWFSFTAIVVLILLNMLIAILVEAFMDVKDGNGQGLGQGLQSRLGGAGWGGWGGWDGPTTIMEDLRVLFRRARGRHKGEYWRYDLVLRHLYSLGPPDFHKAEVRPFLCFSPLCLPHYLLH